jgi:RNA recognition motif-containing protein
MKGNKLYLGNLSYSVTNTELKEFFAPHAKHIKSILKAAGPAFVCNNNSIKVRKL